MKKIIQKLYFTISYNGIDKTVIDLEEKDSMILVNQYIFLLSIIFFLHSIFTMFFVGFAFTSFLLVGISIMFALSFALPKSYMKNSFVISAIIIALTVIVTFYSSFCGFESGTFLFYFPLTTSVFIFFSWNSNRYYIIFLLLFILSTLYLSILTDFELIEKSDGYMSLRNILFIFNASCTLLLLVINSYSFSQKTQAYYFSLNRNGYKKEQIENLTNEVLRLQSKLNKDLFSEGNLKELIDLIPLNENFFLEKFEIYFPEFFKKLDKMSENPLSISDLKICAMLKLGFTAKQIAIYSKSSIRSADGRIYRVRKKINISSDVDSKTWFKDL